MFNFLVTASLRNRIFVLVAAAILMVYGAFTLQRLPVDVFPDLNEPVITLMTEAEGLAPEEVELLVSYPIETAMNGMPGVTRAHEPRRGPNGGQKVDIGNYHDELVAEGNALRLFLFDAADWPIPAAGTTAQAVILAGGRQAAIALVPLSANALAGSGDFTAARGMRAVVTLTLPGQRPTQARFTPMDQN